MSAGKLGVDVGSHMLYEDDPDQVKVYSFMQKSYSYR